MGRLLSQEKFIEKANKKHNNIYDYSLLKYNKSHGYVDIVCKKHGAFSQKAYSHLDGHGCKLCSVEIIHKKQRKTLEEFITKSNNIHNYKYDYSGIKTYINNTTKVNIRCIAHNKIFYQSPKKHLYGQTGCKLCSKISVGERLILNWLTKNKYLYECEKSFNGCRLGKTSLMRFDFYIPNKNLLIEFDGEQHFKCTRRFKDKDKQVNDLKKIQERDDFKNKWAKKNGYDLLRIPYTQIEDIDKILNSTLRNKK